MSCTKVVVAGGKNSFKKSCDLEETRTDSIAVAPIRPILQAKVGDDIVRLSATAEAQPEDPKVQAEKHPLGHREETHASTCRKSLALVTDWRSLPLYDAHSSTNTPEEFKPQSSKLKDLANFAKTASMTPFSGNKSSVLVTDWRSLPIKNFLFEDSAIMRGIQVAHALNAFGKLFSNKSTSTYYDRSKRVDHLEDFISHNWSTPGSHKFLTLAIHFNIVPSVVMTLVVASLVTALTSHGCLSGFTQQVGEVQLGYVCIVVGVPMFWCILFTWQQLASHLVSGPAIFVDKACVHQTDPELKKKGIENLAAFVYYSWSMLVCYSDVYLQRLWTVYEFASFLMLHPGGTMHIRPILLGLVVVVGAFASYISFCAARFWYAEMHSLPFLTLQEVALTPAVIAFAIVQRPWAVERAQIGERVKRFRICEAKCSAEEDRVLVQQNIISFMKLLHYVPDQASDEDIYTAFEALVRKEVPHLLAVSFGRVGVPYLHVVLMFLPQLMNGFEWFSANFQSGASWKGLSSSLIFDMTAALAIGPLCIASTSAMSSLSLKSRIGVQHALVTISVVALVNLALWSGILKIIGRLYFASADSDIVYGLYLVSVLLIFILAFLAYRPVPYTMHKRRLPIS